MARVLLSLALLSIAAPAGAQEGEGPRHGHEHRFHDPERHAREWNDPARDAWQKPAEVVAVLELSGEEVVVDLGAGTGYFLPHLADVAAEVIALDVEQPMIDYLDRAIDAAGWEHVRTHLAPFDGTGLEDDSVDAVLIVDVWHHVEHRAAYAAHLLEVVRPGGVVVLVDFLHDEGLDYGPPAHYRIPADEVAETFRTAGFEVEVVEESLPRQYVVRARRPAE